MRRSIVLASSLALGGLLSGCATGPRLAAVLAPGSPTLARVIEVAAADNGRALRMPVDQDLVIALAANRDTGYQWRVRRGDPAVLRQRGEPAYRQQPAPAGAEGSGGTTTLHFTAVGAGSTRLELAYERPWETYTAPARNYALDITAY